MIRLGTVFRSNYGFRHYWFVISDPRQNTEKVACVNLTTFRGFPQEDLSCELAPGDHEIVRHRSWVYYGEAKIYSRRFLENWLRRSMIDVMPSLCTPAVLHRLHAGAFASDSTPEDIIALLREQNFGFAMGMDG